MVVIPAEASSPDSEPVSEKDDLMDMDASQQVGAPWEDAPRSQVQGGGWGTPAAFSPQHWPRPTTLPLGPQEAP